MKKLATLLIAGLVGCAGGTRPTSDGAPKSKLPEGPPKPAESAEVRGYWKLPGLGSEDSAKITVQGNRVFIKHPHMKTPIRGTYDDNRIVTEKWEVRNIAYGVGNYTVHYHWELTFYPPDMLAGTEFYHHPFMDGGGEAPDVPAGTDTSDVIWERTMSPEKVRAALERLRLNDPIVGKWEGKSDQGYSREYSVTLEKGVYYLDTWPATFDGKRLSCTRNYKTGFKAVYEFTLVGADHMKGTETQISDRGKRFTPRKVEAWRVNKPQPKDD